RDPHELVDVRVAADDAVHDDDVVRLDGLDDEVGDAAVDTLAQPALGEELCRLCLVLAGQLDVGRALRAHGEQLELDRPHSAADLEHGVSGHVSGELDQASRSAAEPALSVAAGVQLRLPRAEHALIAAGIAAPCHERDRTPATGTRN